MIIYFFFSFWYSLLIIYLLRKIAIKYKITDKPNERKVHTISKPLLGGLAIYLSIVSFYLFYIQFIVSVEQVALIILAGALVLLGLFDDVFDMKAIVKLGGQVLIAYGTSYFIVGMNQIDIFGLSFVLSPFQSQIIITIYFVALINAFNLVDGLDGLATGMGLISLFVIILVEILKDSSASIIIIITIGALVAFLFYNFYPSTIFLGDSGSMLIGYLIAFFSITEYKSITITTTSLVFLVAFLPILDAGLSFTRRKVNGFSVFKADSLHFHHRLLKHGYSHQKAVLLMYLFMSLYAVDAVLITVVYPKWKAVIVLIAIIETLVIFEKFYLLSDRYKYITKFFRKIRRVS